MSTKTIRDPDLGEIKLTKYKGAKNLRIKVHANTSVHVTMPYRFGFAEALAFVQEKHEWIKKQIESFKISHPIISNPNKAEIEKELRRKAHSYLPFRLKELATKHGLSYQRLSIRNTRTRWGSCSSKNNINLCIHLMRLPEELIDYVILHELAHTIHKNHSVKFWNFLSLLLGADAKTIDKKLKAYKTFL